MATLGSNARMNSRRVSATTPPVDSFVKGKEAQCLLLYASIASSAPRAANTAYGGRPFGQIASAYGLRVNVEVLEDAEGYYIGTREDGLPFSRESVEYFPNRATAERALVCGTWTQRSLPVRGNVPASSMT